MEAPEAWLNGWEGLRPSPIRGPPLHPGWMWQEWSPQFPSCARLPGGAQRGVRPEKQEARAEAGGGRSTAWPRRPWPSGSR